MKGMYSVSCRTSDSTRIRNSIVVIRVRVRRILLRIITINRAS